jgi:hypothetical protein
MIAPRWNKQEFDEARLVSNAPRKTRCAYSFPIILVGCHVGIWIPFEDIRPLNETLVRWDYRNEILLLLQELVAACG